MAPADDCDGSNREQVALVVGGGIGGLAAALALHKAGVAVRVFEQASELSEIGAGINLLPGGVEVLHDLGMEEALQSTGPDGGAGVQTSELVYCAPKGTVILSEKRGLAAGEKVPQYSIHRGWLHRALLCAVEKRIGEGNVFVGHRFAELKQDADAVVATFDVREKGSKTITHQASFKGDILIGADGIRSAVRAQLLPGEEARYTGWRIYRGVVEVDSQIYDGKSMLLYGTGSAASVLYPICERRRQQGKTLLNWGINCHESILAPELQGRPGEESWTRRVPKSEVRHIVDGWVFPQSCFPGWDFGRVIDETPEEVVTCYALFDRDPVEQWTFGRVTLLGDSAHPLLPFGSQGAGQAMLDVAALSRVLEDYGRDLPAALAAYNDARTRPSAKVVLTNRAMGPTKLLKMFEDAVGDKDASEQVAWVASHQQEIVSFSKNYQSITGLFSGKAPAPALEATASGVGTPFDASLGFGRSPAVLVVDFCMAYTEPGSLWYCGDERCGVVPAVRESVDVLAKARERGVPVIYTRVVYSKDGLDRELIFVRKVPKLITWTEDNPLTHICPEVEPQEGEPVIIKKHPGAFFGTPLLPYLNSKGVDTILLIGCSTSGCIRATALEGMQHGFRVVIPRECVGDRVQAVHDANLHDCHAKICDVLPKSAVLDYLHGFPCKQGNSSALPPAKRARQA